MKLRPAKLGSAAGEVSDPCWCRRRCSWKWSLWIEAPKLNSYMTVLEISAICFQKTEE